MNDGVEWERKKEAVMEKLLNQFLRFLSRTKATDFFSIVVWNHLSSKSATYNHAKMSSDFLFFYPGEIAAVCEV